MDRQAIRQQYYDAWQKLQTGKPMTALEEAIASVIRVHPEYIQDIEKITASADVEYFAELGQNNPFMHMGLHLALREQLSTNRPNGIHAIYQDLVVRQDCHEVEHRMIEILAEELWQAERDARLPDEQRYLSRLKALLHPAEFVES